MVEENKSDDPFDRAGMISPDFAIHLLLVAEGQRPCGKFSIGREAPEGLRERVHTIMQEVCRNYTDMRFDDSSIQNTVLFANERAAAHLGGLKKFRELMLSRLEKCTPSHSKFR